MTISSGPSCLCHHTSCTLLFSLPGGRGVYRRPSHLCVAPEVAFVDKGVGKICRGPMLSEIDVGTGSSWMRTRWISKTVWTGRSRAVLLHHDGVCQDCLRRRSASTDSVEKPLYNALKPARWYNIPADPPLTLTMTGILLFMEDPCCPHPISAFYVAFCGPRSCLGSLYSCLTMPDLAR